MERSPLAEAKMQPACIISSDIFQELCTFMKIVAHAIQKERYVPVCLYRRHKCKSVDILKEKYDAHIRKRNYVICARVYFFSCNMPKNQFCVVHLNLFIQEMSRKARALCTLSKHSPVELHSILCFLQVMSLYIAQAGLMLIPLLPHPPKP